MRGKQITRRRAVAGSAALVALVGQGGWWCSGQADDAAAVPSLDEVSVAILGCGIRGPAHAEELVGRHGARITWVCDPDRGRAEKLADQIATKQAQRPRVASDLRTPLDDASLDIVTVATPNH